MAPILSSGGEERRSGGRGSGGWSVFLTRLTFSGERTAHFPWGAPEFYITNLPAVESTRFGRLALGLWGGLDPLYLLTRPPVYRHAGVVGVLKPAPWEPGRSAQ